MPRYRHRCGATIDAERPAFLHRDFAATTRLIRYVEGQTFRRPVLDIAREVGMEEPDVRKLALALANRLHMFHRFPVPAVLGIDDLHIRKRLFTVVTGGATGHAIALIPGGKFEDVRKELVTRRGMDLSQVRCIVSDMSGSNIKVATKLFEGLPAVHVADKWHVLRYVQKALSRVISQELDRLQKPAKDTPPNEAADPPRTAAGCCRPQTASDRGSGRAGDAALHPDRRRDRRGRSHVGRHPDRARTCRHPSGARTCIGRRRGLERAPVPQAGRSKADRPVASPAAGAGGMMGAQNDGSATAITFDPALWLGAFTAIGGGYVIGSDKRPFLLVNHCDGEHLTSVMAQIVGHPDRVEAVRDAIEQRWA